MEACLALEGESMTITVEAWQWVVRYGTEAVVESLQAERTTIGRERVKELTGNYSVSL